jgi:hypothetical protein
MKKQTRSKAWRTAVIVAVLTRVLFFAVAWLGSVFLDGSSERGALELWDRWDVGIFLRIAEGGYGGEADPHSTAFMWGFPLAVRLMATLLGDFLVAGLVVNFLASIVALHYIYRLAEETVGTGKGSKAAIYLALFPTAVFLVAPYSEALFLAGAIGAFYHAKQGQLFWTSAAAALAMSARLAGVFLLLGIAAELLVRGTSYLRTTIVITVGSLPIVGYMAFLKMTRGDPFYFLVDQELGWGRMFVGPIDSLRATIEGAVTSTGAQYITWSAELLGALIAIIAVALAVRRREWGYATYMASFTAALLTSTWYLSIPRMLLTYFPIQLGLAGRLNGLGHSLWLAASTALSVVGVAVFTRGGWFF